MARWIVPALVLLATPASAATLCVNTSGVGGCFSSIQAAVDASTSRDVIEIAAGTYSEHVGLQNVGRLTLQGAGAGATIIEDAGPGPAVSTFGRADVTIVGVAIRNGDEGVFVGESGRLTLRDSSITDHTSRALHTGRRTRVTLDGCLVSGNGPGGGGLGGLATIRSRGNHLAILRSTIVDNQAAAIYSEKRTNVVDSTIAGNVLGGIDVDAGTISGSTVSGNGSGVDVGVTGSGGGTRITSSTISGNAGPGLQVAPRYGVLLDHVTVAGNQVAGLFSSGGRITLRSTIVADNQPTDCAAAVRLARANLIETTAGCTTSGMPPIVADPVLGPLASNGGPTETHALLPGSPAIGVLTAGCSGVDQRGVPRSRPCDLGAYETP